MHGTQDSVAHGGREGIRSRRLSPTLAAAAVYALTAVALFLWYPRSPRLTIDAGPTADFAGFTPDGQSMLTLSQEKLIQFWNLRSGDCAVSIKADEQSWESPEFSSDGKHLSVRRRGFDSGVLSSLGRDYYDVASGAKISTVHFPSGGGPKAFVGESPDGMLVAAGVSSSGPRLPTGHGEDDATLVYDTVTGEIRCRVIAGTAATFNADSKTLAVATSTEPVARWAVDFFDAATGNKQSGHLEGDGYVFRIAYSPKGDKLALAVWEDSIAPSETRGIQLWNLASEKRELTLPMDQNPFGNLERLHFLADGHVISVTRSTIPSSFTWDLSVSPPDNFVGKSAREPFAPTIGTDGRLAAINDVYAKRITVQRLGTGNAENAWRHTYAYEATPIAITPDERLIVSVDPAGHGLRRTLSKVFPSLRTRYDVIDIASGTRLGSIPLPVGTSVVSGTGKVGISPDGQTLVTSRWAPQTPGKFTIWNVPTATPWLAIFGFAILPAVAIGWLLRQRQRSHCCGTVS